MTRSSTHLVEILKQVREGRVGCAEAREDVASPPDFEFPNSEKALCFLEHYWDDEDLRLRDEEYRTMQDKELDKLIHRLKQFDYANASKVTFLNVS
jgi:hypothetical protein